MRLTARFKGHVQGVGFRFTASQIAARDDIVGYVQNRPDGSVLLVAEGEQQRVTCFVADVAEAMGQYITSVERVVEESSGEFASFEILT